MCEKGHGRRRRQKYCHLLKKSHRGSRARTSQSRTRALKDQGKSGKNLYRRNGAGSIPITRSKRTSLWIQRFQARPGTIQGGVFAVLWRFWGVEAGCVVPWRSLTAADRSLGGVTQGLARCIEAESVNKCGLASKGSAPRQKVRPRALTDQTENGKVPRKARRPSLKNRVMLDLDQACAEVVLHTCWIMVCINYIVSVTTTRLSK